MQLNFALLGAIADWVCWWWQDAVGVILAIMRRITELGHGQDSTNNTADSHAEPVARQSSDNEPAASNTSTEAMNTEPDVNAQSAPPEGSQPEAMDVEGTADEAVGGEHGLPLTKASEPTRENNLVASGSRLKPVDGACACADLLSLCTFVMVWTLLPAV